MPRKTLAIAFFVLGVHSGPPRERRPRRQPGASAQTDYTVSNMIGAYCSGCHNGRMRSPSGVLLDQFDATRIAENPELWSRAYRQLQAGTMPPVGAPRPDRATSDATLTSIERALGAQRSAPAAPTARRSRRVSPAALERRARCDAA